MCLGNPEPRGGRGDRGRKFPWDRRHGGVPHLFHACCTRCRNYQCTIARSKRKRSAARTSLIWWKWLLTVQNGVSLDVELPGIEGLQCCKVLATNWVCSVSKEDAGFAYQGDSGGLVTLGLMPGLIETAEKARAALAARIEKARPAQARIDEEVRVVLNDMLGAVVLNGKEDEVLEEEEVLEEDKEVLEEDKEVWKEVEDGVKGVYRVVTQFPEAMMPVGQANYAAVGHITQGSMIRIVRIMMGGKPPVRKASSPQRPPQLPLNAPFRLTPDSVAMDVGSGMGHPSMSLAACAGCAVIGIEIQQIVYETSLLALQKFHEERQTLAPHGIQPGRTFFHRGDVLDLTSLQGVTHLYSFNVGMEPKVLERIVSLAAWCDSVQVLVLYDAGKKSELISLGLLDGKDDIEEDIISLSAQMPGKRSYRAHVVPITERRRARIRESFPTCDTVAAEPHAEPSFMKNALDHLATENYGKYLLNIPNTLSLLGSRPVGDAGGKRPLRRNPRRGQHKPDREYPSLADSERDAKKRLVYVRLGPTREETHESSGDLQELRNQLVRLRPTVSVLGRIAMKGREGRVLYSNFEDDMLVNCFRTWLTVEVARVRPLQLLLDPLGEEALILGFQFVVPKVTADATYVKEQNVHTDVSCKGEVMCIALHLDHRGELGTLIDSNINPDNLGKKPVSLRRADTGVFAFDTGVAHAGPGRRFVDGPYPRYFAERVFVLMCSTNLAPARIAKHKKDNDFTGDGVVISLPQ